MQFKAFAFIAAAVVSANALSLTQSDICDDAAQAVAVKAQPEASDICWRACFPEEPQCPAGWNAKQLGQCWTCCRDDGSLSTVGPAAVPVKAQVSDICNLCSCFPGLRRWMEPATAWGLQHDDDSAAVAVKAEPEASDICWRACFHEKPKCPTGWNAKQLGECWTCCKGDDSDDLVSPDVTIERVIPASDDTEQNSQLANNSHSRVARTPIMMLIDVDSPHKLIAVYNPESCVTPHSLLAWLAQCEDAFKIFNSRNADKPLAIADQIRIMGHAMQEPSMQQWWMRGRDKYLEMTIDDWISALKERWLSTSGVNDAARICYGLKQGDKDFKTYATELAYHRNIVGDIIIPEITYKNLLLFGAHPVLMYDVLALYKFDACAPELTSSELESIMSTRWDAIVSTGRHNPGTSSFSKPGTGWAAKSDDPATQRPAIRWSIGFWVLVWAITLWILSCCWAGGAGGGGNAAMGVQAAMEVQAAMGARVATGGQEGTVGMEVQQVEMVLGVQEVQEGPGQELVRVAQPLLEEELAPVAQPVLEGQAVEQAAQVVWVAREAWEPQQTPSLDCIC
ncbi:hypothetical protein GGX14DRAFT_562955 [Mycena pura]|uniref:Retrotransposon gag domain-containing protein n=1 Tax=Mycena pura TaxID=153505 RepID=A0AAD6VNL0_9AGAR|nr:hypothetical protein GGX14DRAFT_562955 [Mycena pura]